MPNTQLASLHEALPTSSIRSIADHLETMSIARDRLVAKGYGDQHPVPTTPPRRAAP